MNKKISFIVELRFIACILVVISHYIGVYGAGSVSSVYPQILPKNYVSGWALNLNGSFAKVGFNFGPCGVSIFFLITAFLCIYQLSRDCSSRFLLKRIIRIYPVYIVSVILAFFSTILYTKWANTTMPFSIKQYMIQATLLGDWIGAPGVDGIAWTLMVQLKMYLIYYLLFKIGFFDNCKKIIITICIYTCLLLITKEGIAHLAMKNMIIYRIILTIVFSSVYIIFGLIGVAIYKYYSKQWNLGNAVAASAIALFSFVILSVGSISTTNELTITSYLYGTAIFTICFLCEDGMCLSKIVGWISDMSYSLFVVHGLIGYYLLSILDSYHVRFSISLIITVACVILASYIMHRFIEKPCTFVCNRIKKAV